MTRVSLQTRIKKSVMSLVCDCFIDTMIRVNG